jgi:hypothetical protein
MDTAVAMEEVTVAAIARRDIMDGDEFFLPRFTRRDHFFAAGIFLICSLFKKY